MRSIALIVLISMALFVAINAHGEHSHGNGKEMPKVGYIQVRRDLAELKEPINISVREIEAEAPGKYEYVSLIRGYRQILHFGTAYKLQLQMKVLATGETEEHETEVWVPKDNAKKMNVASHKISTPEEIAARGRIV